MPKLRPARLASSALAVLALAAGPAAAQGGPPQAWLFGTWTGGLYPLGSAPSAQACLGQPSVIFTRDVVLRSSLTDVTFDQRVVVTARTHGGSVEFRFVPQPAPPEDGFLGAAASPPPPRGFGCESPDVLHVERRGENEIVFPGCADFPNPLVRCPSR